MQTFFKYLQRQTEQTAPEGVAPIRERVAHD
jgi:hypothetical protein